MSQVLWRGHILGQTASRPQRVPRRMASPRERHRANEMPGFTRPDPRRERGAPGGDSAFMAGAGK